MTLPAAWLERLIWLTLGVALTAAGFTLWNPSPEAKAVDPVTSTTRADAPAAGADEAGSAVSSEPECYLGVVLARQASDVAAEVDGVLEEVRVRVGERVERGALIARIDTVVLRQQLESALASLERARAQMRRMEVAAEEAEQQNERRQALDREGLLSQEDKDAARFDREKAQADLQAARAETTQAETQVRQLETTLARAEIRAPFDGTVAQRYLDPGARASPATPIVRLISSSTLLTRFAVPPEETDRVQVETGVRVEVESLGRTFQGVVEHQAPEVDAAAQMVFVEARLDLMDPSIAEIPSGAVARISTVGAGSAGRSCL